MPDPTIIRLDCNQYVAVLYDDAYGPHPIGMAGPYPIASEAAAKAAEWITEGLEWEVRRRCNVVYMTEEPSVDLDIVVSSPPKEDPNA